LGALNVKELWMNSRVNNQVVAARKLYLPGDTAEKVRVTIYLPYQVESQDYACDCEIENLISGSIKKVSAGGVDSVQALLIGLGIAGAEIELINKSEFNSKLVCFPDSIPVPEENCGLPFYDEKSGRTIFL